MFSEFNHINDEFFQQIKYLLVLNCFTTSFCLINKQLLICLMTNNKFTKEQTNNFLLACELLITI